MNTDKADSSAQEFCMCDGYRYWYSEEDLRICECGHPKSYHTGNKGLCIGDVKILTF
jgi:hypothetical protein